MAGKREIDDQAQERIRRWRAEERARGLAALSHVVRRSPDNLVAFLWLARCVCRTEPSAARIAAPRTASPPRH